MDVLKKINREKLFLKAVKFFIAFFLLVLPWQTIWIYREIFWGETKWQYGTLGIYFSELIIWIIAFLLVGYFLKFGSKQKMNNKFVLALIFAVIFNFYIFLSSFWAGDVALALQKSRQILEAELIFLIFFFAPISFNFLVRWLLVGGIAPIILGILQFFSQSSFSSSFLGLSTHPSWVAGASVLSGELAGRWLRAYGSLEHPNIFGGFIFVLLTVFLLSEWRKEKINSLKIFLFAVLPLTALFFSFSRSAWIASSVFLFGLAVLSLATDKKKLTRSIFYMLLWVLSLAFIFSPLVSLRLGGGSEAETRSVVERIDGYKDVASILSSNFLFGVGGGNYTFALKSMKPNYPNWAYEPTHNAMLLFGVEYGIAGLILFALFFWFFIKNFAPTDKQKLFLGLLALFGFLIISVLDHYLFSLFFGLILTSLFFALVLKFSLDPTNPERHKLDK